ncbi:hypothetical protein VIGAN_07112600 [Vigna angularis var. angularis]|uniref:Uncharacterized protein n=1 Tax=Vigna angularis var. angularis TaxID=157739 RepID=A0A0S3SHY4_PHAAN|nr:hypothetical protein VIGAN_07112600 [Vigna angularis var. angularis]
MSMNWYIYWDIKFSYVSSMQKWVIEGYDMNWHEDMHVIQNVSVWLIVNLMIWRNEGARSNLQHEFLSWVLELVTIIFFIGFDFWCVGNGVYAHSDKSFVIHFAYQYIEALEVEISLRTMVLRRLSFYFHFILLFTILHFIFIFQIQKFTFLYDNFINIMNFQIRCERIFFPSFAA